LLPAAARSGPRRQSNFLSVFPSLTVTVAGNDVPVSFPTMTNRLYRLKRGDELGTWTTWTNNIAGTNAVLTITDTNAMTFPAGSTGSDWTGRFSWERLSGREVVGPPGRARKGARHRQDPADHFNSASRDAGTLWGGMVWLAS
jgi:hypothetical protein